VVKVIHWGEGACALDVATGKLSEPTLAAETVNPTFLAIHPSKHYLYPVGEIGDFGFGCSPAQGEFLYLWCRGTGARTAVQTLASAGATAIYLAAALRDNGGGTVVTADPRPERAEAAWASLDAAGLATFADVRCGDPLDVLRRGVLHRLLHASQQHHPADRQLNRQPLRPRCRHRAGAGHSPRGRRPAHLCSRPERAVFAGRCIKPRPSGAAAPARGRWRPRARLPHGSASAASASPGSP